MKFPLTAFALFAGMSVVPTSGDAAIRTYELESNAVDKCQAFTPGPSNTIRNRVHGAENIGPPIAVACVFETVKINAIHSKNPHQLSISFLNNSAATVTVTCTLLTSTAGFGSTAYAVTQTGVPFGPGITFGMAWYASDNPTPNATTLGSPRLGVNCTLPTGVMIIGTELRWSQDDGVGT